MTAPEKGTNAEIIRLTVGIPGIGRKGDRIVSNPDDPNPEYRLLRFGSLDADLLPAIRASLEEEKRLKDSAPKGGGVIASW